MDFKRNSVIALYLAGKSQSAIVKALSHIKVNKMFVFRTIKRYKETGSTDKRHRGGKKKTATSREMVQKVKAQIEKNPSLSASQMANELQISVSSMIRILKNELNYKYQDAQSADVPDESEWKDQSTSTESNSEKTNTSTKKTTEKQLKKRDLKT